MNLFIRIKPKWVNFLTDQELKDFVDNYQGQALCIGDLATLNNMSIQRLLKLVEENPQVDLYSSQDVSVGPIYSRALQVFKSYESVPRNPDSVLPEFVDYVSLLSQVALPCSSLLLMKNAPLRVKHLLMSTSDLNGY